MKTIIKTIIAAVALTSSLAMAQSYSQSVAKQSRCQAIGDLWAESWESDTVLGKKLKQYSKDHQAGKIDQETMNFVMMIFIYSPHREKFRSAQDAYMAGWAECMDGR